MGSTSTRAVRYRNSEVSSPARITNWDGTGDANIGIHGPLNADAQITGAISHGCIRLPLNDLAKLGSLPAGTPIDITS